MAVSDAVKSDADQQRRDRRARSVLVLVATLSLACSACVEATVEPTASAPVPNLLANPPIFVSDVSRSGIVLDYAIAAGGRIIYTIGTDANFKSVQVSALDMVDKRVQGVTSAMSTLNPAAASVVVPQPVDRFFAGFARPDQCSPGKVINFPGTGFPIETLATDVEGSAFATSGGGKLIAFVAIGIPRPGQPCVSDEDSLVVMDVGGPNGGPNAGRRRTIERGLSSLDVRPHAVSEAGSVVYVRTLWKFGIPQRHTVMFAPVAGGTPREVASVAQRRFVQSENLSPDVLWQGDTPHMLVASFASAAPGAVVEDVDGTSMTRTRHGSLPDALFLAGPLRRSADGGTWAAWAAVEDRTQDTPEPRTYLYRLFVKTAGAAEPRAIMEVVGRDWPVKLQIAPDGRHVGFLYQSGLYYFPIE